MIHPLLTAALAWIPFVQPPSLPAGLRLWMFPPLAFCVALVYRATRARPQERFWKATCITFVNIVVGMCVIAVAIYGLHMAVLWLD